MTFLFTSESVSEGHPDKICDQISDTILDACLDIDPQSRVAAETFVASSLIFIGGEITSNAVLNIPKLAKKVIKDIGYTNTNYGLDYKHCTVLSSINRQSNDIAQGVNVGEGLDTNMGAGDQGMMFGYACTQTDTYMPLPIHLAHQLMKTLTDVRKTNEIAYLRPDGKSQVTVEYVDNIPKRIDTIVLSTQHEPDINHETIRNDIIKQVIEPTIPTHLIDHNTRFLINPTGRFVTGGPEGDAGLTGRKIIVDTYGGWAAHGGGAFSGKDASKVDRAGAYMARYIAKNIVSAGIADDIQVQLAYAIGISEPVSIHVEIKGNKTLEETSIIKLIKDCFDLSPKGIIETLGLTKPIFKHTAVHGHFGRTDIELPWEKCDKADLLRNAQETIKNSSSYT